jgi:YggT family protein
MVSAILITTVNLFVQIYTLLIVVSAILSFFMSPFEPIRQTIDRFVNPLLNPIRRIVPPMGGFDFSPLVLLLIIQFAGQFITAIVQLIF